MDIEYGAALEIREVKDAAGDDGWTVAGYASTYGNVDHSGDVVERGAFDESLAAWRAGEHKIRFLNAHRTDQILGRPLELKSDGKGLHGTFRIARTSYGTDVHTLLKDGALDAFSIGYVPTDVEFATDGTRRLKAVDLLEISVVAIPSNEQAAVTTVKQSAGLTTLVKRRPPGSDRSHAVTDPTRPSATEALRTLRQQWDARPASNAWVSLGSGVRLPIGQYTAVEGPPRPGPYVHRSVRPDEVAQTKRDLAARLVKILAGDLRLEPVSVKWFRAEPAGVGLGVAGHDDRHSFHHAARVSGYVEGAAPSAINIDADTAFDKLPAVVGHELLHIRQRAIGAPSDTESMEAEARAYANVVTGIWEER